ncbi:apolipoprotein N-acyltransferase [Celerinatantimonas diazotrophica]|uniref:Apolipoprotein N-acyltransferase n=1 Tax=Celerinatantimonas diazotrophica TaxID=412034 RepID=A0A4R1K3H1_9GAMM|nr:apolipoprotein N-acyltransferase [Celerinatantimonas diazotrophica]TCK58638.1 apolipoprotein N-acyltransferase [Celerinatantimonas diazotrophica]CAG9297267.1 Apolipoprotein N-acyltransferase [Celerinatantimonas diazotrophica]
MLKTLPACLIALIAGAIASFSFAPYQLWPIIFVSFAGLIYCLEHSQAPFRIGLFFGLGLFCTGLRWVHVSMYLFGGIPLTVSYLLVFVLALYLALFPALACYLACKWPYPRSAAFRYLAFPAAWMVGEWLRARLLTGFPWLMPGYSQVSTPLANFASIVGVYGVSVIVLWVAAALYSALCSFTKSTSRRQGLIALSIIVVAFALGTVLKNVTLTHAEKPLSVTLVQGNESIATKWAAPNRIPTLNRYWKMTRDSKADIVVWPESALPFTEYEAKDYLKTMDHILTQRHQTLITGIIHQNQQTQQYYNALVVLGQKTADVAKSQPYQYNGPDRYYKRHLLPIGEFVPFASILRPLAKLFDLPMSNFSRGKPDQPPIEVKGHHWLSAICYEIAFGTELNAMMKPDIDTILTISNDTWFGHSIGPAQHLQIAQMRAIEFQRPVVRATNTGITALINRHGEISAELPMFKTLALNGTIIPATGQSIYQRIGLWPIYILFIIALIGYWMAAKRVKNSPQNRLD